MAHTDPHEKRNTRGAKQTFQARNEWIVNVHNTEKWDMHIFYARTNTH